MAKARSCASLLRLSDDSQHFQTPPTHSVTDSSFNSWKLRKRLVLIHEIYEGDNRAVYDKMKDTITETEFEVNKKYVPQYGAENWVHVGAASNSHKPMYFAEEDRRWLIPKITGANKPLTFWKDFRAWLAADGLAIIHQWAIDFVNEKPEHIVNAGKHAPRSAIKDELIEESKSEGRQIIEGLARFLLDRDTTKWRWKPTVITDRDTQFYVMRHRHLDNRYQKALETCATIRRSLTQQGMRSLDMKIIRGNRTYYFANCEIPELVADYQMVNPLILNPVPQQSAPTADPSPTRSSGHANGHDQGQEQGQTERAGGPEDCETTDPLSLNPEPPEPM